VGENDTKPCLCSKISRQTVWEEGRDERIEARNELLKDPIIAD
jgi:hypothetical protein